MGDIADMHVEAYQAGLDPNEMDGADWADFYADDEGASLSTIVGCLSMDCRTLISWIDDLVAWDLCDEDERFLNTAERAKALRKYLPEFEEPEKLIDLVVRLNEVALDAEDRLAEADQ